MTDLLDDMTEAQADAYLDAMAKRNKWRFRAIVTVTTLLLIAGLLYIFERDVRRAWRDLQIGLEPEPELAEGELLMTRLHAHLLPTWAIYQANIRGARDEQRAEQAFQKMHAALEPLPRARAMADDLRNLVVETEVLGDNGKDIFDVGQRWNQYMDERKAPWWIDVNVRIGAKNSFFYVKTYKLLGDVQIKVQGDPYRARFAARAVSTNVIESFLGHTSPHQDGAIILADRLYDFALSDLWPLMDPGLDGDRVRRARAFAPKVRAEISAVLSKEHVAKLKETARLRHTIESNIDAIRARYECGSTFRVRDVPWDGMPDAEYEVLRAYAERDTAKSCPSIKKKEAEAIIEASEELKAADLTLRDAVGALVAFSARGVSVHEARHARDHDKADSFQTPLPCGPCEGVIGRSARAEASAYLASFAHPETAYTNLFQACEATENSSSPHARAMHMLKPRFSDFTCVTPPADLIARAKELETEYFGRSEPVTLPDSFPSSLELFRPPKAASE